MSNNPFEDAFNAYFGSELTGKQDMTGMIAKRLDSSYTYKPDSNIRSNVEKHEFITLVGQLRADDNVDSIEQFCNIVKPLLNAAWGSDWGEFSPDLKKGEDSSKIILPQITAEINSRDVAEGMPLKPVLMNTVKEVVDGIETGDSLLVYRQWFDCNIEFDFYGRTAKEVRDLQSKFESLISVYSGYLKRHGVSEIVFLKEMSARNSLNFTEQTPMKCLVYYVRFERITPVRESLINKINTEIGIKELNNDTIKTVIEKNKQLPINNPEPVELEFDFDFNIQNTGVDYNDI